MPSTVTANLQTGTVTRPGWTPSGNAVPLVLHGQHLNKASVRAAAVGNSPADESMRHLEAPDPVQQVSTAGQQQSKAKEELDSEGVRFAPGSFDVEAPFKTAGLNYKRRLVPSPLPSPSPSESVLLTVTASGSVSDYADTSSLQQSIAIAAGLEASAVTLSVAAASVIITATIEVPMTTTAATVQAVLSASLATPATASAVLGITVEAVPVVLIAYPPSQPPLSPPQPPSPPRPPLAPGSRYVITAEQLLVAADDSAVDRLVLAAGSYDLTRALSIGRPVTIEAEEVGTVVLDANGLFGPVVRVNSTVTLSGLNVTGGAGTDEVCFAS